MLQRGSNLQHTCLPSLRSEPCRVYTQLHCIHSLSVVLISLILLTRHIAGVIIRLSTTVMNWNTFLCKKLQNTFRNIFTSMALHWNNSLKPFHWTSCRKNIPYCKCKLVTVENVRSGINRKEKVFACFISSVIEVITFFAIKASQGDHTRSL